MFNICALKKIKESEEQENLPIEIVVKKYSNNVHQLQCYLGKYSTMPTAYCIYSERKTNIQFILFYTQIRTRI
jgi:hypothetical protein